MVEGPLTLLFVINIMPSSAGWWVQWAALGIGIAWVISPGRVLVAMVLAGLAAYLNRVRS